MNVEFSVKNVSSFPRAPVLFLGKYVIRYVLVQGGEMGARASYIGYKRAESDNVFGDEPSSDKIAKFFPEIRKRRAKLHDNQQEIPALVCDVVNVRTSTGSG